MINKPSKFLLFLILLLFQTCPPTASAAEDFSLGSPLRLRLAQRFEEFAALFNDDSQIAPSLAIQSGPRGYSDIAGNFNHPSYSPLDNHWYFAALFSALHRALLQPDVAAREHEDYSDNLRLLTWGTMATLLERIHVYSKALSKEERFSKTGADRIAPKLKKQLTTRATAAQTALITLLLEETESLNPAFAAANRSDLARLKSKWPSTDMRAYRTFFRLSLDRPETTELLATAAVKDGWLSGSMRNQLHLRLLLIASLSSDPAIHKWFKEREHLRGEKLSVLGHGRRNDYGALMFFSYVEEKRLSEKLSSTDPEPAFFEMGNMYLNGCSTDPKLFFYAELVRRSFDQVFRTLSEHRFGSDESAVVEYVLKSLYDKSHVSAIFSVPFIAQTCQKILQSKSQKSNRGEY